MIRTDPERSAPRAKAKIYNSAGVFNGLLGRPEQSEQHFLNALDIFRALDDQLRIASILCNLGVTVKNAGNNAKAKSYYQQSIAAQQGITPPPLIAAITRQNLGVILLEEQDLDGAERYLREALVLGRELNAQRVLVFVLWNLGQLHKQRIDIDSAAASFHAAIEHFWNKPSRLPVRLRQTLPPERSGRAPMPRAENATPTQPRLHPRCGRGAARSMRPEAYREPTNAQLTASFSRGTRPAPPLDLTLAL